MNLHIFYKYLFFGTFSFFTWTWLISYFFLKDSVNNSEYNKIIELWYAFAIPHALDALAVVYNFNRSMIHQWHYFVSLRMISISFLVVYIYIYKTFQSIIYSIVIFTFILYITRILHTLIPKRHISIGYGSFYHFVQNIKMTQISWTRALCYSIVNGGFGILLIYMTPQKYSYLNPIFHITFEVSFLGLMNTKQTPQYIIFATPIVQACTLFDWGYKQLIFMNSDSMEPFTFLCISLLSRLTLYVSLKYFYEREDFDWIKKKIIIKDTYFIICYVSMCIIQHITNINIHYYYIYMITLFMHTSGLFLFLIPASMSLASDS